MMYASLLDGDNGIRVSVGNKKDQGLVKAKQLMRCIAHITLLNDECDSSNDGSERALRAQEGAQAHHRCQR